ncbi:MAG: hypothetical protein ACI382_00260, partial [Alloprevotella sp.]
VVPFLIRMWYTFYLAYTAFEQPQAFEEFESTFPHKERKILEGQLMTDSMHPQTGDDLEKEIKRKF